MAFHFPAIDPVAFSVGPVRIHWYALSYVVGIVLSAEYAKWLLRHHGNGISSDFLDRFAYFSAILGVIVGGRLGHVLFYDPLYYAKHPLEIFMTWQGGMSFHGGLVGVLVAAFYMCRRHQQRFFGLMDVCAVGVPIALGLGRCANFVNGELFGTPTTKPWGVIFPGGGGVPRHPTQLYEALSEGLLITVILSVLWFKKPNLRFQSGYISGLFLFLYGTCRFCIEFLKDPLSQSSQTVLPLTNGHLLSIPMIIFGIYLVSKAISISGPASWPTSSQA